MDRRHNTEGSVVLYLGRLLQVRIQTWNKYLLRQSGF